MFRFILLNNVNITSIIQIDSVEWTFKNHGSPVTNGSERVNDSQLATYHNSLLNIMLINLV